jgi:hypothetical protein
MKAKDLIKILSQDLEAEVHHLVESGHLEVWAFPVKAAIRLSDGSVGLASSRGDRGSATIHATAFEITSVPKLSVQATRAIRKAWHG